MNAFGLSNQMNAKALITKVLEGGPGSGSFAASLNDPRYTALATAFNFKENGAADDQSETTQQTTVSNFYEQTLENNVGQQNQGAQMALYFKRMAPQITSPYSILGDKTLSESRRDGVQSSVDLVAGKHRHARRRQSANCSNVSQLQDPTYLQKFIERFTASYDAQNPTGGNSNAADRRDARVATGHQPESSLEHRQPQMGGS